MVDGRKNAIASWLLNFRGHMLPKTAIMHNNCFQREYVSFYLPQKRLLYLSLVYFHFPSQVTSHSLNKEKEHYVLPYNLWIAELQRVKGESGAPGVRNFGKPGHQAKKIW